MKDAIALEGKESPYVNIIAVRKGDKDKKEINDISKNGINTTFGINLICFFIV